MSIKISELPSATSVNDNDILPIVQDGTTKKATKSLLQPTIATAINSSSTNDNPVGAKAVYDYSAPIKHDSEGTNYGQGTETKYGHCKTINNLTSASYTAGEALAAYQGKVLNDTKEDVSNKTHVIDENSTDEQYPDAQIVYNKFVEQDEKTSEEIAQLQAENEALLGQIPQATVQGENIHVEDSSNLPIKDFAISGNATQDGAPTPDTPQDIHVVTGDNTLKMLGKNIIPTQENAWEQGTLADGLPSDSSTRIRTKDYYSIERNTNYYISVENTSYAFLNIWAYDSSYNAVEQYFNKNANINGATSLAINFDDEHFPNAVYIKVLLKNAIDGNITPSEVESAKPMLEASSSKTSYEPYTLQTQLLSLGSIELAKIGNYTDRIYKNNGKWYVEKNIGKYVLNGSQDFVKINNLSNENYLVAYRHITGMSKTTSLITNRFVRANRRGSGNCVYNPYATEFHISISTSIAADVATLKTWLGNNNLNVYWAITPTTTEITDTTLISQLEAILQMHTNKNVTDAWIEPTGTNAQAGLTLTYYKDLETIIDKIDSLEARVSLLE